MCANTISLNFKVKKKKTNKQTNKQQQQHAQLGRVRHVHELESYIYLIIEIKPIFIVNELYIIVIPNQRKWVIYNVYLSAIYKLIKNKQLHRKQSSNFTRCAIMQ